MRLIWTAAVLEPSGCPGVSRSVTWLRSAESAVAAGCCHSLGLNASSAANQSEWQVPASPAHLKDSHKALKAKLCWVFSQFALFNHYFQEGRVILVFKQALLLRFWHTCRAKLNKKQKFIYLWYYLIDQMSNPNQMFFTKLCKYLFWLFVIYSFSPAQYSNFWRRSIFHNLFLF